jgi:hypothetical protein
VRRNFAEGGLRKWVAEKWVDIGAPKKDGKYQPCGRSKGSKRKYPKCVPLAKATRMTKGQKASAVKRKRAAGNPGGKPTNVKTFVKKKCLEDNLHQEVNRQRGKEKKVSLSPEA